MSTPKELHFFDDETGVNWSDPDYSAYHRHFSDSLGQVCGEATPIYTYWPPSIPRLQRYHPGIRLIVSLRDPVRRAYSHWEMQVSRGLDQLSFSSAIREGRARVVEDEQSFYGCHRVYSYVERGFYAPQIRRILDYFPREQILFITLDQLKSHPDLVLDNICAFLGVMNYSRYPEHAIVQPTRKRTDLAAISEDDLRFLRHLYSSDISETAQLTGLDLSSWRVVN